MSLLLDHFKQNFILKNNKIKMSQQFNHRLAQQNYERKLYNKSITQNSKT